MTARTTRRSILAAGALALPTLGAARPLASGREVGNASPSAPIVVIPWRETAMYPDHWAVVNGILCVVTDEGDGEVYASAPQDDSWAHELVESVEAAKAWAEARARAIAPQLREGGWCRVEDPYSGAKWALVEGDRVLIVNDEGSYGPAAHILDGEQGLLRLVEAGNLEGEEPYALVKTLAIVALKRWNGGAS